LITFLPLQRAQIMLISAFIIAKGRGVENSIFLPFNPVFLPFERMPLVFVFARNFGRSVSGEPPKPFP
jgi:hypothetical protein